MISEIGYTLLQSRDMAERSLKWRKYLKKKTTNQLNGESCHLKCLLVRRRDSHDINDVLNFFIAAPIKGNVRKASISEKVEKSRVSQAYIETIKVTTHASTKDNSLYRQVFSLCLQVRTPLCKT